MRHEYLIYPPAQDPLPVRLLRAVKKPFEHPGRALVIALLLLLAATQLNAQVGAQGDLKARIRAAGFRVIIGMRADARSHGMLPSGRPALDGSAAETIARGLEQKGLERRGRLINAPVVFGRVAEADL